MDPTEQDPEFTCPKAGTHPVRLTVTDASGRTATALEPGLVTVTDRR